MKVLLTTCLLLALLPRVASLTCYQCIGKGSACNNRMEIECAEDEDICISTAFKISMDSLLHIIHLLTGSLKTCAQSKYWLEGTYMIGTDKNISISANVEVCKTDLCNRKNTRLPNRSELPENGRECPACFTLDSDRCEAQNKISCRGNETKCLSYGSTGEPPDNVEYSVGLQGCVSPNACKVPTGVLYMAGGVIRNNITHLKCTNAPMSPSALEGFAPHLLWRLPFMGMKRRPQGPGN